MAQITDKNSRLYTTAYENLVKQLYYYFVRAFIAMCLPSRNHRLHNEP